MKLSDKNQELANAKTDDEFNDLLDKQYLEFIKSENFPKEDYPELALYYARYAGFLSGRLKALLWQTRFDNGDWHEQIDD